MNRAFHLFAALLIALPLGSGGLCCCLLGTAHASPGRAVAEPAHPCCPAAADPAESGANQPHRCNCPTRDTALVSSGSAECAPPAPAPEGALIAPSPRIPVGSAPEAVPVAGRPPPGRKEPLFRTLSVLLC